MPFDFWSCPHCHRPFERSTWGRQFLNTERITYTDTDAPLFASGMMGTTDSMPRTKTKEVAHYKYTYKCKNCGYEWSEVKTEDA